MTAKMCYSVFLALFFSFFVSCFTIEISTTNLQVSDGDTISISLSNYNKSNDEDQAFTQLATINGSTNFLISVKDIPSEVSFITIQVHAYMYNVSMYEKNLMSNEPQKFVTGTNVGLLVEDDATPTATAYVANENTFEINSLVAVVAYTQKAPYPGGCNMEFDIERSPYQKLVYDKATVTVDAQPASLPKIGKKAPLCEKYILEHDAYRMYMPEQDFTNETYFTAIASMLTVRDIERNADFIPASLYGSAMRRVYSAYPGTGSVYGMVARFGNYSSAYVPIVTYSCDSSWPTSCSNLPTTFSKVLCALTFFLGLMVTMRGHYYFKISMFCIGMFLGGYIGYTIGTFIDSFDITGYIITAMVTGLITSLIWLLLWLTLSSPIPSLILSSLTLGSFMFYIFYFTLPAGLLYLEINAYFWLLFSTFIIIALLIFSVIPLVGNILCFTVLGAYATILSIDYYSGSNLKYVMINGIRRFSVSNFNLAVVQPPYQDKDILLTVFWAFLVILGLYKQCATNWNRAPFPPSTPSIIRDAEQLPNFTKHSEQAPLIGGRKYRQRYHSFNSGRNFRA